MSRIFKPSWTKQTLHEDYININDINNYFQNQNDFGHLSVKRKLNIEAILLLPELRRFKRSGSTKTKRVNSKCNLCQNISKLLQYNIIKNYC